MYYGAKLGFSLLLAGTAATDPDSSGLERALLGGASLLIGLPSATVMCHARRGNGPAVRRWRIVSFLFDLALAAGLTGHGVYLMDNGGIDEQYAGLAAVTIGLMGAAVSGIDLIPFRLERQVRTF